MNNFNGTTARPTPSPAIPAHNDALKLVQRAWQGQRGNVFLGTPSELSISAARRSSSSAAWISFSV